MQILRIFLILFSVCLGTNTGLGHQGDEAHRYNNYKQRYTNCTFVDGNLELVFLDYEDNYDLSFLQDIKEVTGYVLIVGVHAQYVPLTNLRIIRGRTLFSPERGNTEASNRYSLYIALNYGKFSRTVGLQELRFKHLYGKCNSYFFSF